MVAAGVENYFDCFKVEMWEGEAGQHRFGEGKDGHMTSLRFDFNWAREGN
jgi:hypothetical protein